LNDSGDAGTLATTVALARRHALGDLLRRSAARYPDRVAVRDASTTRSFAQLDADASRIANALRERGIVPGDRVAILSRNSVRYAQAIFGVARAGAVLVPNNFMLNAGEVGYVLTHSRSVALLVQDGLTAVAERALEMTEGDAIRVRVILDAEREKWESVAALPEHRDTAEPLAPGRAPRARCSRMAP
jgi:fatty-acyl-CoA synthase